MPLALAPLHLCPYAPRAPRIVSMGRDGDHDRAQLLTERTNLRVGMAAVGVAAIGVVCLYISGRSELWEHRLAGQAFVAQLGGLLLAAVALALLWESFGKRSFAQEILDKVGVGSDIERAGIVRITDQYLKEVEWDAYFANVERLDVVVAYARTWRRTHWDQLLRISRSSSARIRVILPDPTDMNSLTVLADRFDRTPARLREDIIEAAQEFMSLKTDPPRADVHVYFRRGDQVFSCYRLDRTAVVTLYSHSRVRKPVPTIVCQSGGSLYDFIYEEISDMLDGTNSRELLDLTELDDTGNSNEETESAEHN